MPLSLEGRRGIRELALAACQSSALDCEASLSARVYRERQAEMDAYFRRAQLIRSGGWDDRYTQLFPLLEDCPLRDMVLTMYLLRHLRGDAIVEASYVDDSYDLNSLAMALLKERVSLQGAFLRVELAPGFTSQDR